MGNRIRRDVERGEIAVMRRKKMKVKRRRTMMMLIRMGNAPPLLVVPVPTGTRRRPMDLLQTMVPTIRGFLRVICPSCLPASKVTDSNKCNRAMDSSKYLKVMDNRR